MAVRWKPGRIYGLLPWQLRPWRTVRNQRVMMESQAEQLRNLRKLADLDDRRIRDLRKDLATADARARRAESRLAAATTDSRVSASVMSTAQPEFVLVGIPRPDGSKRLQASRQLDVTAFAMTEPDQPPPRWKLGVIMGQLVVIDKPDYQQALAHLMTIWANQDSDQRAQVTGKRAIGQWDRPNLPR